VHELGITQEILAIVMEQANDRKVKRVVLEIGALACVIPDSIRFCFDLCSAGTVAEGAALEIVQPPGQGRCRCCDADVLLHQVLTHCRCGSDEVEWLSGQELRVKEMEVA
jgi:hydrogenase nickel incorporation protein HypA/HybF